MALYEEFIRTGNRLFKLRGYLPPLLFFLILAGLPLFNYPGKTQKENLTWEVVCASIAFLGLLIRFFTIGFTPAGTSGTNRGKQVAESLNTTGFYSIVRHPLYLGNFLMWFGLFLYFRTWWLSLTIVLIFWLYYERIMFAEEEFLRGKFGRQFTEWASHTRSFFPTFSQWRKPELSFSLRKAIRNEYQSAYSLVVSFSLVNLMIDSYINRRLTLGKFWRTLLIVGGILFLVLRTIKKKTNLLKQEGR
ncbi:MAG: isoprenylcysteine carboxylmethyltransferase family protein [candidate division KSB1 bacterium]|nr:isoprenylcysteine carboxylmethyltransferase family protein [candidate division KSB1 bacterium]